MLGGHHELTAASTLVSWQVWDGATRAPRRPMLDLFGSQLRLRCCSPVFVQIQSETFTDPSFVVFDSGGSILALPLPVSILALFVGIAGQLRGKSGRLRRVLQQPCCL
jgi:hypothetical protein